MVLTPGDVKQMRRVPDLVFLNKLGDEFVTAKKKLRQYAASAHDRPWCSRCRYAYSVHCF